jgi:hypothetical protein
VGGRPARDDTIETGAAAEWQAYLSRQITTACMRLESRMSDQREKATVARGGNGMSWKWPKLGMAPSGHARAQQTSKRILVWG